MKTITRAKGGTKERKVAVDKIVIPDLWEIVYSPQHCDMNTKHREQILDCWHLCHDLLRAVKEAP